VVIKENYLGKNISTIYMSEIIEVIKVGGPIAAISLIFLFYMEQKDRRNCQMFDARFKEMAEVIRSNTKAWQQATDHMVEVNEGMKGLKETILEQTELIKDLRSANEKIYQHNLQLVLGKKNAQDIIRASKKRSI
jgi:hypothetical protein